MLMIKLKAFLMHFSLSALIISIFLAVVYFIWYPQPFLDLEGGLEILLLLVTVDLILGPTLTFILYRPKKKGLYFDLTMIAIVQITALLYGVNTVYQERPQYIVFSVDRFNTIPASAIDTQTLTDKSLQTGLFDKPRFVFVEPPRDTENMFKLLEEIGKGGEDIDGRPEFYRDYTKHKKNIVNNKNQLSLTAIIKEFPKQQALIELFAKQQQLKPEQLIFFSLVGKQKNYIIVLNQQAIMVGSLAVNPWQIKNKN